MNKNRKTVEIYFILYLAALVLLIPETNVVEDLSYSQYGDDYSFELKPEKSNMNLILMSDTTGIKIISFDSVNKIYYTGKPDEINFDFIVEDATFMQQINISEDNNESEYFQINHKQDEQLIEFLWNPPLNDKTNKSYNVKLIADFIKDNSSREKRAEFNLNKNFINSGDYTYIQNIADTSELLKQLQSQIINNNYIQSGISEINLIPTEYNIKTIAYQNWRNIINVTGINLKTDLSENPQIDIKRIPDNNNGTAVIKEIDSEKIIIGGKSPEYGSMTVIVNLKRNIDGAESSVEFQVLPQPIGMPEIPNVMYPDRNYVFNPNLPILTNQDITATLKINDKILAESKTGASFEFSPDENLANKTVVFERFVDGELLGQKYYIEIKKYPKPAFSRIQKIGKGRIKVFTKSFGLYNGEENYIKDINIEGNAEYTEIIGQARFDKNNLIYMQVFEFNVLNSNKPFEFKATAVNRKNEKSESLHYP